MGCPDRPAGKAAALRLWALSPGPQVPPASQASGLHSPDPGRREPGRGQVPSGIRLSWPGRAPTVSGKPGQGTLLGWGGRAGGGVRDRASISGGHLGKGRGGRDGVTEAGGSVSECLNNGGRTGAGERPLGGGLGRTQAPPRHHSRTPRPAHAPPRLSETGRIKQAEHSHLTYKTVNTSL